MSEADRACLRRDAIARRAVDDLPGAARLYQDLVALAPDDPDARNDLGSTLAELGDLERARVHLDRAMALAPAAPLPRTNLASVLFRLGDAAAALALLEQTVREAPAFVQAHVALGTARRERGDAPAAIAAFRAARALAPDDPQIGFALGRALLDAGDGAAALALARDLQRVRPGHAGALALETLALMAVGDAPALARLLDHDRLVRVLRVGASAPGDDVAAFNAALAAHVASHPTLVEAPAQHATAAGLHSGSLLDGSKGPIAELEELVGAAVSEYAAALGDDPAHPFVANRPADAFLQMWGVVLRAGGHQIPHIHPDAWLSGVYYPQVPREIAAGDAPDGCLAFGDLDRPFPAACSPPTRTVRPGEGTMVLFPSYFYHHTIPFSGGGTRVSIAFDVVRAPPR